MELTGEDYEKIEKNLKYKKGRAGTLYLLRKQNPAELRACIGRLLEEKSEECHMGAPAACAISFPLANKRNHHSCLVLIFLILQHPCQETHADCNIRL